MIHLGLLHFTMPFNVSGVLTVFFSTILARDVEVDCSFLGDRTYDATLFKDGANAHRIGRDYKCESIRIKNDGKLKIHLAPGGGFALKIK